MDDVIKALSTLVNVLRKKYGLYVSGITPGIIDISEYILDLIFWVNLYEHINEFIVIGTKPIGVLNNASNILRDISLNYVLPRFDNKHHIVFYNKLETDNNYPIVLLPDIYGIIDFSVLEYLNKKRSYTIITDIYTLSIISKYLNTSKAIIALSNYPWGTMGKYIVLLGEDINPEHIPGYVFKHINGTLIPMHHKHVSVRSRHSKLITVCYDYRTPIVLINEINSSTHKAITYLNNTFQAYIMLRSRKLTYDPVMGMYYIRIPIIINHTEYGKYHVSYIELM